MIGHVARLCLLGPPVLLVGAEPAVLPGGACTLIALLMLKFNGPAPRPVLAARLWEEADQPGASANLRQLVKRVRRRQADLGLRLIRADGAYVRTELEGVDVDLDAFRSAPPPATAEALLDFVGLYRGDLLEGVDAGGAELRAWLAAERAELRDRFVRTVLEGAARVGGEAAAAALDQLTAHEPECDEAWQALVRLRAVLSGPSAAAAVQRAYRAHRASDEAAVRATASPAAREVWLGAARSLGQPEPGEEPADIRSPASVARTGVPRVSILMPHLRPGDELSLLVASLLEDVTLGLCRMRTFALISPFASWRIGSRDAVEAAERFGIDYLVSTRLVGRGDRLRVELVRCADRTILWTEHYPISAASLAERYGDIAVRVALSIADAVDEVELRRLRIDNDPTAYRWFLSGQRSLRSLDLPALRRARRAFQAALDIAPGFAPASSGLAQASRLEWLLLARSDKDRLREARDHAVRAVEQDPTDGRGYKELGNSGALLGALGVSLRDLSRAETLAPHNADVLADYAAALMHSSRPEEALQKVEAALVLSPLAPDDYLWIAGSINFFLHRYEAALVHLTQMREPAPAYRLIAACNAMLGHASVTLDFVRKALEVHPDFRIEKWTETIPLLNPDHLAHYAAALRAAGFR